MQTGTPNYYAVIPATVRYDARLQFGARLLYGEITALSNTSGNCWATDSYFMRLYAVSKKTVQRWISELEQFGYIERTVIYADDGKTIDKRIIKAQLLVGTNASPMVTDDHTPIVANVPTPMVIDDTENNTSINNIVEQVLRYLNGRTGKNYKATTKATRKLINARVSEGYKLADFETVIDTKQQQWGNDSKMQTYLRPATLFSASKFESYLNEQPKTAHKAVATQFDKQAWIKAAYQATGTLEGVLQAIEDEQPPITAAEAKTAVRALQNNLERAAE